jgi:hypothetical protein
MGPDVYLQLDAGVQHRATGLDTPLGAGLYSCASEHKVNPPSLGVGLSDHAYSYGDERYRSGNRSILPGQKEDTGSPTGRQEKKVLLRVAGWGVRLVEPAVTIRTLAMGEFVVTREDTTPIK